MLRVSYGNLFVTCKRVGTYRHLSSHRALRIKYGNFFRNKSIKWYAKRHFSKRLRNYSNVILPKALDNFVDSSGEIMWDEGERKEREDSKEEHQKKLDDLER